MTHPAHHPPDGHPAPLTNGPEPRVPRRVLVMPEFNEEQTVLDVLVEAAPFVDRIVVVDDGSRDDSHRLISGWMGHSPVPLDLLRHRANRGMSGALLSGFAHAHRLLQRGELDPDDVIVNLDADGQHDPTEIPALVRFLLEHRLDVALGRRDLSSYPRYKILGNRLLSLWASLLSGCRYGDCECGFRVMRAAALPGLLRYFSGHRYGCAQELGVLLPRLGCRVSNRHPVRVRYYRQGARFRDGAVNATMGLLAWLRVALRWRAAEDRRAEQVLGDVDVCSSSGDRNQADAALPAPQVV